MKKIIFTLGCLIIASLSNAQDSIQTHTTDYTLKVEFHNRDLNGKKVFLQDLDMNTLGFAKIDSTTIEADCFEFKGVAPEKPFVAFLIIEDAQRPLANFLLESGNIEIKVDSTASFLSGTQINDSLQAFLTRQNALRASMDSLTRAFRAETEKGTPSEEFQKKTESEFNDAANNLISDLFNFTKENIDNPLGEFFFATTANYLNFDQKEELFPLISDQLKETALFQQIITTHNSEKVTAVGQLYTDIKLPSLNDKEIALSDYVGKNKLVLIDFWASWCGPCIKEMPNVKAAYSKYKEKGFEIVGISLDNDKEAWNAASKRLNIEWPQMSDLGGWQSSAAQSYSITSIPTTLLLDSEGKIIAKNLRGEELEKKLAEILE